jgi:hypothetical protein|nr:MAG TPA: hypothetical protein [Caudoviricetes sp.]
MKKYNIANPAVKSNLKRISNQIFKLLPIREEGGDWQSLLRNLIDEVEGMDNIVADQTVLFQLLSKLGYLNTLVLDADFPRYRRIIFECLDLVHEWI